MLMRMIVKMMVMVTATGMLTPNGVMVDRIVADLVQLAARTGGAIVEFIEDAIMK